MSTQKSVQGFRLSPQQEHLWLLHRLEPNSPYRVQCEVLIEGDLDTQELRSALRFVVDRHEILRTTFCRLPGMVDAVQVVNSRGDFSFEKRNLEGLNDEQRKISIDSYYDELSCRPFNFEDGKLFRTVLLELSSKAFVLLISLPAVCMDAQGLRILVSEICHSY